MSLQPLLQPSGQDNRALNLYANSITCGEVIVPPRPISNQAFSIGFQGTAALPILLTAPCTTVNIANDDVNLVLNTYTTPRDCLLSISFGILIGTTAASLSLSITIQIEVNGSPSYLNVQDQRASIASGVNVYPVVVSGLLKLTAGDVVSLRITSGGGGSGFTYSNANFSGILI